jgi:hypothetical protein
MCAPEQAGTSKQAGKQAPARDGRLRPLGLPTISAYAVPENATARTTTTAMWRHMLLGWSVHKWGQLCRL